MARTPPDAASLVANYSAGINGTAQQKYKNAIGRVTVNPMAEAAAKVADGTWLNRVTAAQPKLLAALQSGDAQFWKTQAQTTGASAWLASKTKGEAKYRRKADKIAQAAAASSQAAHAAQGSTAKWQAAVNATIGVWGAPPLT